MKRSILTLVLLLATTSAHALSDGQIAHYGKYTVQVMQIKGPYCWISFLGSPYADIPNDSTVACASLRTINQKRSHQQGYGKFPVSVWEMR